MDEFKRFEKLVGGYFLNQLSKKTVCIVGLGGVGGYVVESLARSGIGSLLLIDHDTIDITNINRQLIALHSTVGRKKVNVWKQRILDINPNCKVEPFDLFYTEECKETLFSKKIDFLVDACDTISAKKSLIKECLERGIPFITSMGTGNRFDPSKLMITQLDKTNYDPIARMLRKFVKDEKIKNKIPVLSSSEIPVKLNDRTPGSTSFVPSVAGLLITSYIINYFKEKSCH